jgi:hypothetical protein
MIAGDVALAVELIAGDRRAGRGMMLTVEEMLAAGSVGGDDRRRS